MGKSWSEMIGHGCKDITVMSAWCSERNKQHGARLYKVGGVRTAMTLLETVMAERTLGLDRSNAVSRNNITPSNATELRIIQQMVVQGWMRQVGQEFVLTCAGLDVVDSQRKIFMGVIG
jgi:hypothetical protein